MPPRIEPLITGQIYHVFNKTIEGKRIFTSPRRLTTKFKEILYYYRSSKSTISLSRLSDFSPEAQQKILKNIAFSKYFRVKILAYCFMPTHFHLLLKQLSSDGIRIFISHAINSLTKSFNIKTERKGPLFLSRFKSVLIRSEEQLMHVSRYIHLNPTSSGLIPDNDLRHFPFSSYPDYLGYRRDPLVSPEEILLHFNNDSEKYRVFIENNIEYQRTLELSKHTEKWK